MLGEYESSSDFVHNEKLKYDWNVIKMCCCTLYLLGIFVKKKNLSFIIVPK